MLHMQLGFVSELVLHSHKHLVYWQHTFFSQKVSWHYNAHQHNHTAVSEAPNANETANFATSCDIFSLQLRNLLCWTVRVSTESMSLSLRSKSNI